MAKPIVFLSHIHEEAEIAIALKKLIESKFLRNVQVYVSSSPQSNRPGREWLEEIKGHLLNCDLAIVLAGPHSINRRWINFEAGAVWGQPKPVIPLCHSGIDDQTLGLPLNILTVLRANSEDEMKRLFVEIAALFDGDAPETDFTPFLKTVSDYEVTSKEIQHVEDATPLAPIRGLFPFEFETLSLIAEDDGISYQGLRNRAGNAGMLPVKAVVAVKMLIRKGFVKEYWNEPDGFTALAVDDTGWDWLTKNHDLFRDHESQPSRSNRPDDIPF